MEIENLIDELMFAEERLMQFLRINGNDLSDLGEAQLEKLQDDINRLEKKIEWKKYVEKANYLALYSY